MTDIKCDGLWASTDGAECGNPVIRVCCCRRCEAEGNESAFHICADPKHRDLADRKHLRVYGRDAAWGKV